MGPPVILFAIINFFDIIGRILITKEGKTMIILCDMIDGDKDKSKFEQIYSEYLHTMYSVAFNILNNVYDAEDVVEESLIKVIGILNKIDEADICRPRCKNLMITITKNTAIDFIKRADKKINYAETVQPLKSAEDLYIETEDYQELIMLINDLDEKYRDVLRLRLLHHLSAKETGKILNITEFSVNTRFMRAKALLKEKLKGRGKNE